MVTHLMDDKVIRKETSSKTRSIYDKYVKINCCLEDYDEQTKEKYKLHLKFSTLKY